VENNRTLAIIVTYNPNGDFRKNLESLLSQVTAVLVVDNSLDLEAKHYLRTLKKEIPFELLENDLNLGIAAALNRGVAFALENKFDWVLTLDQDSSLSENYIKNMWMALSHATSEKIGILAPVHFDRKTGYMSRNYAKIKGLIVEKDIVMTSGNLIPTSIFREVGTYDESLFIEYVDHEFCLRIKKNYGYKVVIVPNALLGHSLGDIRQHHWGPWFFFSHNYLPVRRYYRARNRLFLYKKYFGWWILQDQEFAIKDMAKICLVEVNKGSKIWATIEGTLHGFLKVSGSYEAAKRSAANYVISLGQREMFQEKFESSSSEHNLNTEDVQKNYQLFFSMLKNSGYNLLGNFLPLLVGFLSIPILIKQITLERFGILTVVWAMIGYFSLFDFGFSRIITVKVSELHALKKFNEVNTTFWTLLKLIFMATLAGTCLIFIASLFENLFTSRASAHVIQEGIISLRIIAFTLPAITLTAGVKGALEADHQFYRLNIIQTFMGVANFLVPTIVSLATPNLAAIVISLSLVRYLFLYVHYRTLTQTSHWLGPIITLKLRDSMPLIVSGGWISVTNIISPVMTYFDRFFLALMIPAGNLAYYTTPFEIVNRLLIIPSSITRALFPILAANKNGGNNKVFFTSSFRLIFLVCSMVSIVGVLLGNFGLKLWLGEEFASQSYLILAILLAGYFVNSLAWTPFTFIQAIQRPDLTAKAHLIELPLYCVGLFFLTKLWGLPGAAMAWALRNFIDYLILQMMARKLIQVKAIERISESVAAESTV